MSPRHLCGGLGGGWQRMTSEHLRVKYQLHRNERGSGRPWGEEGDFRAGGSAWTRAGNQTGA